MLYRKITRHIEEYLSSNSDRILLIDDADNLSNIPIEVKSGKNYTIVTTYGVSHGKHSGIVQKQVTMDDLFKPC